MAIKELITLEGAEEVKSALKDLSRSGEDFMSKLNTLGQTGSPELRQYVQSVKAATGANTEHGRSVSSVYEAYHILNPVLRAAGLQMEGLRGWAVLARLGVEGLAVAITATVVVALAKLADNSAIAKRRLETLLNLQRGTGTSAIAGLEDDAAKLGMRVEQVQPGIEKFVSAIRQAKAATGAVFLFPPGESPPEIFAQDVEKAKIAYFALVEALRTGGSTQAKATQEAANFGAALGKAGKVTGEVIQSLDPFGGAIKAIGEALNLSGLNAEQLADRLKKNPREIDELIKGLNRLEPALRKALATQPVTEFDDALQRVKTSWADWIKEIETSKPAVGFLSLLEKIPAVAKAVAALMQAQTGAQFGKFGTDAEQAASKAVISWNQVASSIKNTANEAVKAGEQMLTEWQKVQQATQPSTNKWVFPSGQTGTLFAPGQMAAPTAQQLPTVSTDQFVDAFRNADTQIRTILNDLANYVTTIFAGFDFSGITAALVKPFSDSLPGIRDVLLQVEQMIQAIIRQALAAQQAVQGIGAGRPFNTPGFIEVAGGGLIRGPGSSTSDSILAWLSNREFVQPARAVSYYGVEFMEAIRRLQLPRNFLVPKLAEGGMVRSENTRSLTLVLDTQRFALSGKSSVIDALERHATLQGIASIGRPPGWVR